MNETNQKAITSKNGVQINVECEFNGKRTLNEAFIPIFLELVRREKEKSRTFDLHDVKT